MKILVAPHTSTSKRYAPIVLGHLCGHICTFPEKLIVRQLERQSSAYFEAIRNRVFVLVSHAKNVVYVGAPPQHNKSGILSCVAYFPIAEKHLITRRMRDAVRNFGPF
jgi:hypothetical protein